ERRGGDQVGQGAQVAPAGVLEQEEPQAHGLPSSKKAPGYPADAARCFNRSAPARSRQSRVRVLKRPPSSITTIGAISTDSEAWRAWLAFQRLEEAAICTRQHSPPLEPG